MRMYDIIMKKRSGEELSTREINFLVNGFNSGEIPDYQMSALLMAIYFQKMTARETADLTTAMVNSGETLDLSAIKGIKADKHSTGGVGDKVSLIMGPMCAALGLPVAKMSGRGLGHTGGTIDKLESIPGFTTSLDTDRFTEQVNSINIALTAQTGNLTPADKKIYALRDCTATVESMPLIASSIMSKKIASGAEVIVLDVKCGSGAFMKTLPDAQSLARLMVDIGDNVGRRTIAVITDMDEPLGRMVGNSLEVIEAIETLKGNGDARLVEVCLELGAWMLVGSGMACSHDEAFARLENTLHDQSALNKFREWIGAQGGDVRITEDYNILPQARNVTVYRADRTGYITGMRSDIIGMAAMVLGAGREKKGDRIDASVGIEMCAKTGDRVAKGDIIAKLYSNDNEKTKDALERLAKAYVIANERPKIAPVIKEVILKQR